MTIKLPKSSEVDAQLAEAGIETLTYDSQWRQYRVRIDTAIDAEQRAVRRVLARQSRESSGKAA